MALATPVALSITSFDASNSQDFKFVCNGGNQSVANRLTIVNAATSQVVYQNKVITYAYNQRVPANTLTNGIRYYFYFNTFDYNDNMSADSNKVYFYCYSSSTITFENIPSSGIINSASFKFVAAWNQAQEETLSYFQFFLHDKNKKIIDESEKLTSSNIPPIRFEYTFDGFKDDTIYYVSAKAVSTNGIESTSALIEIGINNDYSGDYFLIKATNYCTEGCNMIINNVHEIDGKTNGVFIDDEHLLLENGATAEWEEGVSFLNNSFVMLLWWKPILFGNILRLESEDGNTKFNIIFKRGIPTDGSILAKDYILVEAFYNGHQYISKMSNKIVPINNNSNVIVYMKVVGNDVTVNFERLDATGTILEWNTHYFAWQRYSDELDFYTLSTRPVDGDQIYELEDGHVVSHIFNPYDTVTSYDPEANKILDSHYRSYGRHPDSDNSKDGDSDVLYGIMTGITWDGEGSSVDTNVLVWNGTSNVEYNRITDLWYEDESQGKLITDTDWATGDYYEEHMRRVICMNSIVDALYITRDIGYAFTPDKPHWDNATVMYCEFRHNLAAGNVDWITSHITKLKLKRRLQGTQKWITLYIKPVNKADDLTLEYVDYTCPSGYTMEYALVPCTDDAEWDYSITEVHTNYDGLFLINPDMECKKLYGGVMYNSDVTINGVGLLQPFNAQYPTVVRNKNINYKQTNIGGYLLNEGKDGYADIMSQQARVNMTLLQKEWSEWLNSGKSFIIKDWNGKILLVQITTAPSYTYMQNTGNAVPYITFTTSEIGQYNNPMDLYQQGFLPAEVV